MDIKYRVGKLLPDNIYLKIKYKKEMGKSLNLRRPKTYNEKLQWLKIHDHNPKYVDLVDKYTVKGIVAEKIGVKYIIPTLGVWQSFDEIDFGRLPKQFVLKCTHDSGGVVVCRDKASFDIASSRQKIDNSLKTNYFWAVREWPYKKIIPRIIAEEYKENSLTHSLDDYKFFCFDGVVDNVMVVRGRREGKPLFYHFNKNWELCRYNRLTRSLPEGYSEEKPAFLDEMIEIAEKLSAGMVHVRIDLYEADGEIFFGEYTLYNQSGWESGFDDYSDGYLGSLIHLPTDK